MSEKVKEISPEILLNAYCQAIFPMASPEENNEIFWYRPDPRAILPLHKFNVSRSMRKTIKSGLFEIRYDTSFEAVMRACAEPKPGRDSTWISEEIVDAYVQLHRMGFAHSVETWLEGKLVGGLYGVAIRAAFFGESMFHRETDASKVALFYLVEKLREEAFILLDVQYSNKHLEQFGIEEISLEEYELILREALSSERGW